MARPGGNITGFTQFEYNLAGKWLDLLMEIAPRTSRVAVLRDPTRGSRPWDPRELEAIVKRLIDSLKNSGALVDKGI